VRAGLVSQINSDDTFSNIFNFNLQSGHNSIQKTCMPHVCMCTQSACDAQAAVLLVARPLQVGGGVLDAQHTRHTRLASVTGTHLKDTSCWLFLKGLLVLHDERDCMQSFELVKVMLGTITAHVTSHNRTQPLTSLVPSALDVAWCCGCTLTLTHSRAATRQKKKIRQTAYTRSRRLAAEQDHPSADRVKGFSFTSQPLRHLIDHVTLPGLP
jgi:hypothetical protein